jgi:methylenetetrahydrofolate dehydrogenase (NADP+)/methenyltetrahydrofolate cyclohydrolase
MMKYINCEKYAKEILDEVKQVKHKKTFAIVSVGDNPASQSYIKGKIKDCESCGIPYVHKHIDLNDDLHHKFLLEYMLVSLAADENIGSIILQLPFRTKAVSDEIIASIPVEKDVDGLHGDIVTPATALGVFEYLKTNNLIEGKNITILGRSNLVGKPLAKLLLDTNATVTMCHTKTNNINTHIKNADVIVSAVGKIDMITIDHLDPSKEYHIVDVGINFDSDGKICGDVSKLVNSDKVITTPVPGGVGLLTTAFLMSNVLKLCLRDK